ncbi:MAG: hypothetical protein BMS9Abin25_0790 [Gammaproteobacteria bacterium]|nr:MAG: hypothetical protein BMS9Abin25_0790 [Gammaproteobacteria bacterium]
MCEFISFIRIKETEPKKNRPIGLAFGCSVRFSLDRRCGTRFAQTVLALSGLSFQCSTTQKGVRGLSQKKGSNPVGAPLGAIVLVKNRAERRSYNIAFDFVVDVDLWSRSGLPRSTG